MSPPTPSLFPSSPLHRFSGAVVLGLSRSSSSPACKRSRLAPPGRSGVLFFSRVHAVGFPCQTRVSGGSGLCFFSAVRNFPDYLGGKQICEVCVDSEVLHFGSVSPASSVSVIGGAPSKRQSGSCWSFCGGDLRWVLLMVVKLLPAVYDDRSSGERSQRVVAFWWNFYMEWQILLATGMLTVTSSRSPLSLSLGPSCRGLIPRRSGKFSSDLLLKVHMPLSWLKTITALRL